MIFKRNDIPDGMFNLLDRDTIFVFGKTHITVHRETPKEQPGFMYDWEVFCTGWYFCINFPIFVTKKYMCANDLVYKTGKCSPRLLIKRTKTRHSKSLMQRLAWVPNAEKTFEFKDPYLKAIELKDRL